VRTFVFDAYGTLFDVHSAAARYRDAIGPNADRLSQIWRTKHLEYTWIWAQTGRHTTFRRLAEQSLDFAIASVGGVPEGIRDKLLTSYETLAAFEEVPNVLAGLRTAGARLAILTNGDRDMIDAAVASAGLTGLFDVILTVHEAGIFKPSARVYELATRHFGVEPAAISFQSSNRWDIAGAKVFGFRCVWVNRQNAPDEYPETPPDHVVSDLRPLLAMTSPSQPA
jgi:2-haloacid dehalogenase